MALDVDGTLVDGANAMTSAVRSAVHAMRDSGVETVIATGRGIPGVLDAAANTGLDLGHAVASNGAVTISYSPVEIIDAVTFDASEAVGRIVEHIPDAIVAVEETGVGFRLNRPFPDGEFSGRYVVEDLDRLIADPVSRVVIRAPDHDPAEFAALVESLGLTGTNYFIGYTSWLDLAPEGVSKASGLELLCARLGIAPGDVLAVGDGHNDLEMVSWAGRGVAMGHAPQALKDVADHVTGSIDEDGLAAELARYL